MNAFKQYINVNIVPGSTALKAKSFLPLIMGSGTSAIGVQTISEASQLLSFGYLITDTEFKMALALFSQLPSPAECKVVRKLAATAYDAALIALADSDPDFYLILIGSEIEADLNLVGTYADSTERVFVGRNRSTGAGNGRNVNRELYVIHDLLKTVAVAKLSSEPLAFIGATVPAIPNDTYDLDITVNGTLHKLTLDLLVGNSWDIIAGIIQTELRTATSGLETVVILDGKIVISGAPLDEGSQNSITISAGTTGSAGGDLILFIDESILNQVVTIESPKVGTEIYPDAAWAGRKLGKEPYLTWKWKQLSGIGVTNFSLSDINTILDNNTNTVQRQSGAIYTIDGVVTGSVIKYLDLVIGLDQVKSDIEIGMLKLLLDNESVELSDVGLGQVEQVLRNVLDINGSRGIIARLTEDSSDEDKAQSDHGIFMYTVKIPQRSDISSNDRANRIANLIEFTYVVGGAIHTLVIDGKFKS